MEVTIDKNSGYCFGVEYAIAMAEEFMENNEQTLYCLGDIVHNAIEVDRLAKLGMVVIDHQKLSELRDCSVLIRAHGEPPETYKTALENNINLIDASCPVVLKLQHRIKNSYRRGLDKNNQIVIYGKPGHAEVIGLQGQTNNEAIVIMGEDDFDKIDFTRPVTLYSQTTKSTKGFYNIKQKLEERIKKVSPELELSFDANDSICRQVSNREPQLKVFAAENDIVLFVSGKKSSNGKALHATCLEVNPRSYFIEDESEIDISWIKKGEKVGICGATSTPMWLMERVAEYIKNAIN